MKYGFIIPGGDIHTVADLAAEAEAAGWDGAFYWDGICIKDAGPMFDPWVTMAAMALRTRRVRLGAIISPLSRRRPWKVARETVSLDHLSGGRLVLPVGLGALDDGGFGKVGEPTDRKIRAELLDESLEILAGLWSGEPFCYDGKHYHLDEMTFLPKPVQSPRIPIWVVGAWPRERSMARVLRYDGLLPDVIEDGKRRDVTPDDIRAMAAYIAERRAQSTPFDIVMEGETPGDDPARAASIVCPFAEAGATWWTESRWGAMNDIALVRAHSPGSTAQRMLSNARKGFLAAHWPIRRSARAGARLRIWPTCPCVAANDSRQCCRRVTSCARSFVCMRMYARARLSSA